MSSPDQGQTSPRPDASCVEGCSFGAALFDRLAELERENAALREMRKEIGALVRNRREPLTGDWVHVYGLLHNSHDHEAASLPQGGREA